MNQEHEEKYHHGSSKSFIQKLKENSTIQIVETVLVSLILLAMIISSALIFQQRRDFSDYDTLATIFVVFLILSLILVSYSFIRHTRMDKQSKLRIPWILILILSVIATGMAFTFLIYARLLQQDCPAV
jgi:drug/metabolite transporter (DMT)-like permease